MRIACLKEDLNAALGIVQRAISPRGIMPVLTGVLMEVKDENMFLNATDLEVYMRSCLSVKTELEGKAIVNARLLSDIVKNLKGEVLNLGKKENQLEIEDEKSRYVLKTMPVEDFPKMPEGREIILDGLNLKDVGNAISQVIRSASKDEKRPVLQGIYFGVEGSKIRLVSTDSYRLAVREMENSQEVMEKKEMIIPARAMQEIPRWSGKDGVLSLYGGEGHVRFESGNILMTVREIEGKFPNWAQLIPSGDRLRVVTNKDDLAGAIKRVSLVGMSVVMEIGGGKIVLKAENREVGSAEEEVEGDTIGEEMRIVFNAEFLMDGLAGVEGDRVTIGLTEPEKPGLVKGEDESFKYVIMPIKQ